ncbi:MAG: D-aminoacyl-tRNA deacylase [Paracoccus sp. (in: a-proteobacteria)]|jgi:D-tyrosyl-tRNA(Tyr) deacylase|uniref:D-aminoacyl-tRNA deacylase n=1 Tax=unclassified Paracoccus (in: a-proteobacteria) TaxID=2688777 RepID=UPI000C4CB33F|nr:MULTISPECIES: D-aminoacyl-tRNA deacylase [unclassified Paracoccus (in: a-proteobacteria)]MBA49881.1 D-tyrosyl-tRNA(Tyr) deacylase [Paracoccus sp. (in: a-proteobacteria)]|tara:strand:- start:254 stop:703 length:450 start_codon:yes stop_codon:yes gene_type:complete
MRALVQRVTEASVEVEGRPIGRIGPGLLVLACAMRGDDEAMAEKLAARVARLRIFGDEAGRMNRSLIDMGGGALVVSQFTLAADTRSGNRPGFSAAAAPHDGRRLLDCFVDGLRGEGVAVETGQFGAEMKLRLLNDGPATIWLDSADRA